MPGADAWLDALEARYCRGLTNPEFLKAVRALSWRYVEARQSVTSRSAIDSAGKRAAFAAFYAPLHFLTVRAIARALPAGDASAPLLDLGCGTGVASGAWALERSPAAPIAGIDLNPWAVGESTWTWRTLGLNGRARRGDLEAGLRASGARGRRPPTALLAWAVNELAAPRRVALESAIRAHLDRGGGLLVVEPIARGVSPWWPSWEAFVTAAGGRADEWAFDEPLPPRLASLNEAAGFSARRLTARSLWREPASRAR